MITFPRLVTLAAAILVVAASGCSSSPAGPAGPSTTLEPSAIASAPGSPIEDLSYQVYEQRAEQAFAAYYHCMTDRGWELRRHGDSWLDGFGTSVPHEQLGAYETDVQECEEISGRGDLGSPVISAEEAGRLYDLLLGVADCVRALGYHVDDPPSRQSFVDDLVEHPIPRWHPHNVPDEARGHAQSECPVPDWP